MNIPYKKSRIRYNLIWGVLFILAGIIGFFLSLDSVFSIAWILIGLIQFSIGYFEMKRHYLTINEEGITKNSLFPKAIKFQDVLRIRRFKGVYKIETATDRLIIDKRIIDNNSLLKLNDKFEALNF